MSDRTETPPNPIPPNIPAILSGPWFSGYNAANPSPQFLPNGGAGNSATGATLTPGSTNETAPPPPPPPRSNAGTPGERSPVAGGESGPAGSGAHDDSQRNAAGPAAAASTDSDPLKAEKEGKVREVGNQAVWSLSSCKPGFGVDQLRDDSLDTYWQSDGPQPHLVNIQFRKKTAVRDVCIFADYKQDESYTPSRISIRAGNHFNDLQEIESVDLQEPTGWTFIPLQSALEHNGPNGPNARLSRPLRTFMVQIAVLSNHQNGRDTHMRQIKIFAPVETGPMGMSALSRGSFTTNEFSRYSCIR